MFNDFTIELAGDSFSAALFFVISGYETVTAMKASGIFSNVGFIFVMYATIGHMVNYYLGLILRASLPVHKGAALARPKVAAMMAKWGVLLAIFSPYAFIGGLFSLICGLLQCRPLYVFIAIIAAHQTFFSML